MQQEANSHMLGDDSSVDNPNQTTATPSELVVSSSSPAMLKASRNLIGICTHCAVKAKEHHNDEGDDEEDSKERKRKAMDRIRKVSTTVASYCCCAPCVLLCVQMFC